MVLEQSLTGRPRERAKAQVAQRPPYCHLCGLLIDMQADRQRDPLAFAVDEIVPRSRGGSAVDDANLGAAHRHCNTSRHDHPLVSWDPAWPDRKYEPEEVRARCRRTITALTRTPEPLGTW